MELRLAIEPEAAALVATRATPDGIAELRAAYDAMEAAVMQAGGGYLEADLAFHETILALTGNAFFAALTPAIDALLRVSFRFSVKSRDSARSSLPLHKAVLDAIASGDAARAKKAIRHLIEAARDDIESDMTTDDFLFHKERT